MTSFTPHILSPSDGQRVEVFQTQKVPWSLTGSILVLLLRMKSYRARGDGLVKCLLHKHGDWNLDSQYSHKMGTPVHVYNPSPDREKPILGARWPTLNDREYWLITHKVESNGRRYLTSALASRQLRVTNSLLKWPITFIQKLCFSLCPKTMLFIFNSYTIVGSNNITTRHSSWFQNCPWLKISCLVICCLGDWCGSEERNRGCCPVCHGWSRAAIGGARLSYLQQWPSLRSSWCQPVDQV